MYLTLIRNYQHYIVNPLIIYNYFPFLIYPAFIESKKTANHFNNPPFFSLRSIYAFHLNDK